MAIKQILRSPIFWISLAIMALLFGNNSMNSAGVAKEVDTWKIIENIEQGRAKSVTLVDGDQLKHHTY